MPKKRKSNKRTAVPRIKFFQDSLTIAPWPGQPYRNRLLQHDVCAMASSAVPQTLVENNTMVKLNVMRFGNCKKMIPTFWETTKHSLETVQNVVPFPPESYENFNKSFISQNASEVVKLTIRTNRPAAPFKFNLNHHCGVAFIVMASLYLIHRNGAGTCRRCANRRQDESH